ncbi:MAG: YceD family protein [Sulfitobacter sp.]
MSRTSPSSTALRVADLSQNADNAFELRPDAETMRALAEALELSSLRKLSFVGRIVSMGKTDWQLEARLGATVVQPCVVTLEPVTTRIDTNVLRRFISDYSDPDEPEAEMPEDETSERLGQWIDPAVAMHEALALAVPDYPRKEDAELGQLVYTKPGETPMTDEDARPFAGLADLKNQLKKGDP